MHRLIALSLVSPFLSIAVSAASLMNGGFETGTYSSWTTVGSTPAPTSSAFAGSTPPQGLYQGGMSKGFGSVTDSSLESTLGLTAGALDNMGNGNVTTGSGIAQTYTVTAPSTLTFNWNFLTDDFAFFSLNGSITKLADTNNPSITSPTAFDRETGYHVTLATAGTYNLAFGAVNVSDTFIRSALLVDNITLTTLTVPEP